MEDPALLIRLLKIVLLVVLVVATLVIFGEIVAMARGQTPPRAEQTKDE